MAKKEHIVEFISSEITSFKGISKESAVFIDYTERKKGQGFIGWVGDGGLGKSSRLQGVAYGVGVRFGVDKKRLMNSKDGDLLIDNIIKVDGTKYSIETDSRRMTVKKEVEGTDKWTTKGIDQAPQEFLDEVLGPVLFIPSDVQFMKGKDQILYFQEQFASGEEAGKAMKTLEAKIANIFDERRDLNREVKSLTSALELEPLFQNYEASQEKFKTPISADKEKAKYEATKKKKEEFDRYSGNLESLQDLSSNLANNIEQLEAQLATAKKEKQDADARIEKGIAWVKENEGIVKEYATAEKEWINLSLTLTNYEKWKDILRREKQMMEKQDEAMEKDAALNALREDLLKLTKRYLPKVDGLTIKVAAGLDKTDSPEGVFYKVPGKKVEQPLHELSEDEYEDMWLKILEAIEAQFVFLENLNRFGSNVHNTLNKFVKSGGTVFYTLKDKSQKEVGITFKSKVD